MEKNPEKKPAPLPPKKGDKVEIIINPYSVMKPPGGFLDFLKITYLFIIY